MSMRRILTFLFNSLIFSSNIFDTLRFYVFCSLKALRKPGKSKPNLFHLHILCNQSHIKQTIGHKTNLLLEQTVALHLRGTTMRLLFHYNLLTSQSKCQFQSGV